jgi:hypothetical protein
MRKEQGSTEVVSRGTDTPGNVRKAQDRGGYYPHPLSVVAWSFLVSSWLSFCHLYDKIIPLNLSKMKCRYYASYLC